MMMPMTTMDVFPVHQAVNDGFHDHALHDRNYRVIGIGEQAL